MNQKQRDSILARYIILLMLIFAAYFLGATERFGDSLIEEQTRTP